MRDKSSTGKKLFITLSALGVITISVCACSSKNTIKTDVATQSITEESTSTETYIEVETTTEAETTTEIETTTEAETTTEVENDGKSNGQQDYAVTLPQVVDENGNPYPTDEYGGVIVPETTAPEETTQVAENETPTSEKPYAGLEITLDNDNEEYGYNIKVYGDDEYFVITEENGTIHEYDNLTEARNCLSIIKFEKDRDPDLIEWDGTLSGKDTMAMTDEELRQSVNDPNAVHGKVY